MELTPPSTHSPASPFRYSNANTQQHPIYEYPSPAHSDSRYRASSVSNQGLGLYSCSMPENSTENSGEGALHTPTSQNWSNHNAPERRTSHATPNILSAEYDPFAPYHPAAAAPYSHDIYATQTATSPLASSTGSQRSSLSSAPASEIFTQASSVSSYTPRMKMDGEPDYHSGHEGMIMQSPQESQALLASSAGSYPGSLDTTYYPEPQHHMGGWPKVDYGPQSDLPPFSTLPVPAYARRASAQEPLTSTHELRRVATSVPRTRQPRRLTTKEDANFQCQVKGCGKLFGRSYNFKAHMETHDASREYPFPCPLKDCTKKFVRKTDLQRHHQSVHMKQRNFRCDYCGRFFARKDTLRRYVYRHRSLCCIVTYANIVLRRHMEDGCSKRFDIETVDFRPAAYPTETPLRVMTHPSEHPRSASYSAIHHFSPPHSAAAPMPSPLTSAGPGPYLDRPPYIHEHAHQESVWTH